MSPPNHPQLTLYYAPVSCALVPFLLLTEAKAQFEIIKINNYAHQNLTPEYLQINPKGKVPALAINHEILTENIAIQLWIAQQFPQANLLPIDPYQQIKAISWISWFASAIHPHLTPINKPQRYCDLPGSEENVRQLSTSLLFKDFEIAENYLINRQWFFDDFTTVDAYFFWCFRRAVLFELDLSQFPNCQQHFERMSRRESTKKVIQYESTVIQEFTS
jgi:glutathione S-transferase